MNINCDCPTINAQLLARYMFIKSCETSSKGTFMLSLLRSAVMGSQDFKAVYKNRLFYGGLDDELDTLRKGYDSWRPGLMQAFTAMRRNPEAHIMAVQVGSSVVNLPISDFFNRFVYCNGCTTEVRFMADGWTGWP
jgi:hypothetical protein